MPYDSIINHQTNDKTGKKINTKKLRLIKLVLILESQTRARENNRTAKVQGKENRKTKPGFTCR